MIVPMKKVTVLVVNKDVDDALLSLRRLGLLHIKHVTTPTADELNQLEEKITIVEQALQYLKEVPSQEKRDTSGEVLPLARKVVSLVHQMQELSYRRKQVEEELTWFEEWGEVSLKDIAALRERGVWVRLYRCSASGLRRISPDKIIKVVGRKGRIFKIVFFATDEKDTLAFPEEKIPVHEYSVLKDEYEKILTRQKEVNRELESLACFHDSFVRYHRDLLKEREFYRVKFGMADEEKFSYLQGFLPHEGTDALYNLAKQKKWGLLIQDPDDPSEVPTLIRNPRWVRIIEPVFKLMGTLPGYNEYDISMWFLLFLTLFFAILIGDAGYGMLFLAATFFMRKKFKHLPPEPFRLMYVFSAAAIIWGVLSGTYFGAEPIAHLPVIRALIIQKINSFVDTNQAFMMYICFVIGAIHLSIAHTLVAVRMRKSLNALSQIGWILVIWGLFFVAGKFVVGKPFPFIGKYLLITGGTLVFLFSHPQRNILKGVGQALMDVPLKMISSFGDVVSYLRLFAVGYATVVVASSFNDMALSMGFSNFVRSFGAAVIIFFGHALNIILGFMAIIVHGVRLNMLEFSGHLGMEWSGKPYKPFRENGEGQ